MPAEAAKLHPNWQIVGSGRLKHNGKRTAPQKPHTLLNWFLANQPDTATQIHERFVAMLRFSGTVDGKTRRVTWTRQRATKKRRVDGADVAPVPIRCQLAICSGEKARTLGPAYGLSHRIRIGLLTGACCGRISALRRGGSYQSPAATLGVLCSAGGR